MKKFNIFAGLALTLFVISGSTFAETVRPIDINTDFIPDHSAAEKICPEVCASLVWNGQWANYTTRSVCGCKPAPLITIFGVRVKTNDIWGHDIWGQRYLKDIWGQSKN